MAKKTIRYTDYFPEVMRQLRGDGLLLVSTSAEGKPNVMTIGWGTIGNIWGRPMFLALVRPSRHTYSRLEEVSDFTVNVPAKELAAAASHCGTVSGRDHEKFEEMKLTTIPARQVRSPIIAECLIHYECRIVHRNDVAPDALSQAILEDAYPQGDFHRVYFGEIVAAYADEDAGERLRPAAKLTTL